MRRFLLFLVLLALAVPPLAVLATNVVLKTRMLRSWVNEDPESTFLEYADASSDFPGRVVVRDFVLRSRDQNTEWIARLGEARLTVRLLDLPKKTFHASSVRGTGLSFRLRERLAPERITRAAVERQPPIAGFPSPPRADPRERTRPEKPSTWRVALEGLAIDRVSEIWVEGFRFEGDARVAGAFTIHPTMTAEVAPSRLDIASGALTFGKQTAVEPISGTVACAIPEFRTHAYPGNEVWKIIRGHARIGGGITSLAFLNPLLGEPKRPRFGEAKGRIAFVADVGSAAASGEMRIGTEGTVVRFGDQTIRSRTTAHLKAKHVDFARWTADFSGSTLDIRDAVESGPKGESGWSGRFMFGPSRLDMKSGAWTTRIEARAKSPGPILTMLDVKVPELGTKLIKMEDLDARAEVRLGQGRVEVHGLTAEGNGALVEGEYAKKAAAAHGAFLVSKGILHVGVGVDGTGKAKLRVLGSRRWFKEHAGRPSKTDDEPGD